MLKAQLFKYWLCLISAKTVKSNFEKVPGRFWLDIKTKNEVNKTHKVHLKHISLILLECTNLSNLGSILPTFYEQPLHVQIPKAQKNCQVK